jgi:hypothetical protein
MTSRERILAAIEHRQPDKVPVDLGATPSSGISAIAYGGLKRHLGLANGQTRIYDVIQQLAQPEDAVLDRLRRDVMEGIQRLRRCLYAYVRGACWRLHRPAVTGNASSITGLVPAWLNTRPMAGGVIHGLRTPALQVI